jgi:hypothetical protein
VVWRTRLAGLMRVTSQSFNLKALLFGHPLVLVLQKLGELAPEVRTSANMDSVCIQHQVTCFAPIADGESNSRSSDAAKRSRPSMSLQKL